MNAHGRHEELLSLRRHRTVTCPLYPTSLHHLLHSQAYVAQQSELCGEVRIQACLRLREQASRLQTLLLDAPAVGIADAALRLMKAAAQDNTTLGTQYSREAGYVYRLCCCVGWRWVAL